jgi:rfaE bifunctional protein kinase chain/domain
MKTNKEIIFEIKKNYNSKNKIVLVYGNFNILHPGHLRLLKFASDCGDCLVVALNNNETEGVFVSQNLRLDGISAIKIVNYSFILDCPVEDLLNELKPDILVKGKEHESQYDKDIGIINSYGGKIIYSSGEMLFSTLELLEKEFSNVVNFNFIIPNEYIKRHKIDNLKLDYIDIISNLKVIVIGDLIIDTYTICDPIGMSQEEPVLVASPIYDEKFIGGAGIVAAHAAGLGASVTYLSVVGNDSESNYALDKLNEYKVNSHLFIDESRPTTVKQRFKIQGKSHFRLNKLKKHDISNEIINNILDVINSKIKNTNLVIFSDFNYGCLPQKLVDKIVLLCNNNNIPMVADCQSSSQVGDISRYKGMTLITPTEHEARIAMRDSSSGLVVLSDKILELTQSKNMFLTLGGDGLLINRNISDNVNIKNDLLPALNTNPKDTSGAGDCLLTTAALLLTTGADIWTSAYLASVAAACQVSRYGNIPLTYHELKNKIRF